MAYDSWPSSQPGKRIKFMFEQAFKNIDNVLWKDAGCTSELDCTEQSSWLPFLKYLDTLEKEKAMEAQSLMARNTAKYEKKDIHLLGKANFGYNYLFRRFAVILGFCHNILCKHK